MAQDGSVAPKERVNIVYKPATGDVQSDVELPLKLMVLGDFTMREDARTIEDRKPVSVDKDNFNDVMKGQGISLSFNVDSKLSDEEGSQMPVKLDFQNIKDFEPDSIARQVPELARLLELREALKALKGPLANIPDFRRKVQETITNEQARETLLQELGISDK